MNKQEFYAEIPQFQTDNLEFIDKESSSSHQNYATFKHSNKRIDFVLAYETETNLTEKASDIEAAERYAMDWPSKSENRRRLFEKYLQKKGLELEYVDGEYCEKTKFVLLHIPFELLCKQAEKLGIEMKVDTDARPPRHVIESKMDKMFHDFGCFSFDPEIQRYLDAPLNQYHPFRTEDLGCFEGSENEENFFSSADRIYAIYDILSRTRFGTGDHIGIENALRKNVYSAAFPLHEYLDYENLRKGLFNKETVKKPNEVDGFSCRQFLYWFWAKQRYFYKFQPHFLIKEYFGSKIALYFILFGNYTRFLIPWSVMSCIIVVYSFFTRSSDVPSNDVCLNTTIGDTLMCPICDHWCDYTLLKNACFYSKLSYIFNNYSTVIYAILMSIGATMFTEMWKRCNADVAWKLGLLDTGSHEEGVRLAYLLKSLKSKGNSDCLPEQEPNVIPLKERIPRLLVSCVGVLFFLSLILAAAIGTIVYRLVMMQVFYRVDSMRPFASIIVAFTTSILNLGVILLLSYFYNYLALKLTDWEYPRTQSEFESSYTVKVFLFQFINYYASVFYVAFYKGNFSGLPGRKFFGLRPEDCDPSGCMVELVILLATLMFGKILYNIAIGFFNPVLLTFTRGLTLKIPDARSRRTERQRRERRKKMESTVHKVPRWEWDYALTPVYDQFLFVEYLDIVIQFGFVTLFITAFPLAPLFALINNMLEIRTDAYNFTVAMRRPLPERAREIGVWLKIIDKISQAAVLTNAFVIAFTTDFIPRFVYKYYGNNDLNGFLESSLSLFKVEGLNLPHWTRWKNATECWFRDYRFPPCSLVSSGTHCDDNYGVTPMWWIILGYRLGFIVVFAHIILIVKSVISYIIPDMPTRVFIQLQRQRSFSSGGVSVCTNDSRLGSPK